MAEATLVLNTAQIQEVLTSPSGPVGLDLLRRGQRVTDQAKVNASGRPGPNVQTGRLRSSIGPPRLVGGGTGLYCIVGTSVHYAVYVERGTGPYTIHPKNRKALYWKGAAHPVRAVRRQGNRPYPFLVPALSAGRGTSYA